MTTRSERAATARAQTPEVPLTIEGSSVLHQVFRIRWSAWRAESEPRRQQAIAELAAWLAPAETKKQSAIFSVLGHKGDVLFVHLRDTFRELSEVERGLKKLGIAEFLDPAYSFLSIVELGLYESTVKTYEGLCQRGIAPHSEEWNAALREVIERQAAAMRDRLFPEIPEASHICFYPMDRRRGEDKNWYTLPLAERNRQMQEHGLVGRRYAGKVRQIISGSIGLDDWEWGVDLFADDPVWFKRLIYEMRFDEVSALYALFGPFYVGLRVRAAELGSLFP